MRLVPRSWHLETLVCAVRGHCAPAARAALLRAEDRCLGQEADEASRFCRCLRCDLWILMPHPPADTAAYEVVPPLEELQLPRRGKAVENAVLIRLIAVDRGIHAVLFTLLALGLTFVEVRLPRIQSWAQSLVSAVRGPLHETAPAGSHAFLTRQLEHLTNLHRGQVQVLLGTAIAYALVEGLEAVYLWKERRWAEYLTVLATVGFIPFEIHELILRVTPMRVVALIVNLAVVVWLVWNKRLFGLRGGEAALHEGVDWKAILAHPRAPELDAQSRVPRIADA